jgi:hypothetical protein
VCPSVLGIKFHASLGATSLHQRELHSCPLCLELHSPKHLFLLSLSLLGEVVLYTTLLGLALIVLLLVLGLGAGVTCEAGNRSAESTSCAIGDARAEITQLALGFTLLARQVLLATLLLKRLQTHNVSQSLPSSKER